MKFSPPSSTLTDYILPGQEQFWQSFDISQPACTDQHFWCDLAGTNQATLPRPKGHSLSQGFLPGGPDIFWSPRLRSQRCSGWGFRKWDMWGLFCYTNVRKRRNPRGFIWRCTLMEFKTQTVKDCPKLNLVVFFHFFLCIWVFLWMLVQCQSLLIFVRQEQYKSRYEGRIVPKL